MDKPEVLVHISTPATRANDDLYRSLANAYLQFEPHQPVDDEALSQHGLITGSNHHSSEGQAQSDNAVPAIRSMDSYGSFPSQITSGSRSSDRYGSDNYELPSSPENVSISRLERLERIQTKWKQQRTPRSSLANSRRQNTSILILPTENSTFIEDTQQAFATVESQLMDDLSASSEEEMSDGDNDEDGDANMDIEIESSRGPFMPSSGNVQADTRLNIPHPSANTVPYIKSVSQSKARAAQLAKPIREGPINVDQPSTQKSFNVVAVEKKARAPLSQHSAISVDPDGRKTSQLSHPEDDCLQMNFEGLPTTVCPPSLEISVESPCKLPSQVTPYLEKMKQQNPGRFKSKAHLRAIEADERGHWRVDCRLWPKHVQRQFWIALQKDVSSGRLGWGVTLHRDAARTGLGLVRLYCWGEIVEHVWLSLWLHSGGRVCSTGAVWIDAGDVEVITIP